jgi:very-short-patch-repair endonuclease
VDGIRLPASYTWTAARSAGVTRRQIGRDGVRLGRGLYLSRAVEPDLTTRCAAWAEVLPPDSAFSGVTAAVLLGASSSAPPRLHVALTPRRVLPQHAGLIVHARRLAPQDVVVQRGLQVTSGAQTFLDLAAVLPAQELVAVGDALTRAGHLDGDRLTERLARADRVRGVIRARACAPLLDPRAQSRPESVLRYWLTASDLPDPEVQVAVCDRWGRVVAHGDLGYSHWKIVVEYEGRQHADQEQFRRDIDRHSLMGADGWLVLRFAAQHIVGPHPVVDRTRGALRSRGWRPGPS